MSLNSDSMSKPTAFPSLSAYRAVVFDFDGTAIPNSPTGMPSERLINAVAAAQAAHHHLIGATGRPLGNAKPVIQALGLTGPVIVGGGTTIYDASRKEVMSRQTIPTADLRVIKQVALAHHLSLAYETNAGVIEAPAEQFNTANEIDIVYALADDISIGQVICDQLNSRGSIVAASAPGWFGGSIINITPRLGTKEHAVAEVLTGLGLTPETAIGVGDGHNDLHLFDAVGFRVAMGNAVPELKEAAHYVTASIDEDGLAEIIEAMVERV